MVIEMGMIDHPRYLYFSAEDISKVQELGQGPQNVIT
jgi:hypothetical protein